ncbi:MAG: hypothetical protein RLZZ505_627 [Verrucomicrobiota bacterium]|jgi:autotransporter-associated beta strand protein
MKLKFNPFLKTLAAIAITQSAHAATGTWNVDADGLWGTNTNWLSNVIADDLTSTANFTNDITADRTVSLNADRTLNKLVFSDSATGTAGSWILNNNGVSTNNLILSGTTGAATGTAPVIEVGALGSNKTATISAIIQGSYGLTKTGAGTLVLSSANTYTGGTNLNEGVVRIGNTNALNSSGNITFGGGTLQFGTAATLGSRIKNSASAIILDINGLNLGTTNLTGVDNSNTGGLNLTNSGSATATPSGGTLRLNAANTFTGGITVGDKTRLRLETTADALGGNLVTVQNGGQLFVNSGPSMTITNNLNIAGAGWAGDNDGVTFGLALGAIRISNSTTDISGQVTLSSAATITATSGITGTISGKITGNHALTIGAAAGTGSATTGTVTLTSAANDYTGATIINTGTLKLNTSTTIATSSSITVGNTASSSAVLDVTTAGLTVGSTQTLSGTGKVLATGQTVTASGTISPGNSGTATLTLDGGTLALNGTTDFTYGLGTLSDQISLINSATLNLGAGTLGLADFLFSDSGGFGEGVYTLITGASSFTGTLDSSDLEGSVLGWDATLSMSGNNLILTVIPEPRAALLGGLGMLALLRRRRA